MTKRAHHARRIAWGAALCCLTLSSLAVAQTQHSKTALPPLGQAPAQSPAAGVPQAPQQTPQWVVTCANTEAGLDCRAGQALTYQQAGRNIQVSAVVRMPPDTKKPRLLLQVPLGVQLPKGLTVQFGGGGGAKVLPFQSCDMSGCLAEYAITEGEIASLVKGNNLMLSVQAVDNSSFKVNLPAAGFAAAYAKMTAE